MKNNYSDNPIISIPFKSLEMQEMKENHFFNLLLKRNMKYYQSFLNRKRKFIYQKESMIFFPLR